MIHKIKELGANGKLVEVEDSCWLGLDDCCLEDGGQGTSADAVMEHAGRISDAHNSMVEKFQKEHMGEGPVMDCFTHLRGGRQRTIENVDGDSAQHTTTGRGSGESLPTKPVEEEFIGRAHHSVTAQDASSEDSGTSPYIENLNSLASSGSSSDGKPAYDRAINTQPQPNMGDIEITTQPQPTSIFPTTEVDMEALAGLNDSTIQSYNRVINTQPQPRGAFRTTEGDMALTTQPQPNGALRTMEVDMKALAGANDSTIQSLLDSHIESLSSSWKGSIPFYVYPVTDKNNVTPEIFDSPPQPVDICDYLNGQNRVYQRLYFSPMKYPPPTSPDDMKVRRSLLKKRRNKTTAMPESHGKEYLGWIELRRDLEIAAHDAGNPIIANGAGGSGSNNRIMKCAECNRSARSTAMDVTSDNPFRETSLIHNRRNNRRAGMKGPKRFKTSNPCQEGKDNENDTCTKKKFCRFRCMIKWDEFGFFVQLEKRSGNEMHQYHPRISDASIRPYSTRLLTQEQVENTRHVVESASNKAAGRNFLYSRYGRYCNAIKIAHLASKDDRPNDKRFDDIARMIEDFEDSQEIAFTSIADVPINDFEEGNIADKSDTAIQTSQQTITVCTKKSPLGIVTNDDAHTLPTLEQIEKIAKEERKERAMAPDQILFIGVAWVVIPAFRFFMLCPEVVWCDVTSHSNNKGFHLLTFSCRTSVDRQVIFMWMWIPNQQRFSFRWVFQHAIPNLIPKWLRDRVRFIMKDGDPQQRNEILYAMKDIFCNAIEGACGFHIGKTIFINISFS